MMPVTEGGEPPTPVATEDESLVGRLAEEMARRWRSGERSPAEEFLDRHPRLWQRPEAALELVAEELALREEHGAPLSREHLAARFPQWADQVRALGDCQRLFGARPSVGRGPRVGDSLGEFRLVADVGRGAHGRVFLATQGSLGGRPVVLKLTPPAGGEHLSLARLQHTHIVPLHSAHEFPGCGLRGLCMPYFGGGTLAALLAALGARPQPTRTGAELVAALRTLAPHTPAAVAVGGPACDVLARSSYVAAVCRIGVCLADALHFAHERGFLHLDVKPSNVLVAADGVPMLLDFHLARPPLRANEAPPASLGGTPGYMPPEQAAAVQAVRRGVRIPAPVDARADVYALGVLLAEALGHTPVDPNPQVSAGLADVLARCTAADPADRYATAEALAADLRRHLSDRPLRGVANRSIAERWGKWRRRRPYALSLVVVVLALAAGGVSLALHTAGRAEQAAAALREGEKRLGEGRFAEAVEVLRGGESLASGLAFHRSLGDELHAARVRAERGQAAIELHQLCDRLRPLYSAEAGSAQLRAAEARCRELWAERDRIRQRLDGQPTPELDRQWRADLLDLGILAADLHVRTAPPGDAAASRRALAILAEAESLLGPSAALYLERAAVARALGLRSEADDATRRAGSLPPRTPWEHLLVGRAYLGAGDTRRAAREMELCLEREPGSLWANYFRGVCARRLGENAEAVAAFSVCVAQAPRSAWCFCNRGLAHTGIGRFDLARADFDRALALEPTLTAALIGRATLSDREGRRAGALADLRLALSHDPSNREARQLLDRLSASR